MDVGELHMHWPGISIGGRVTNGARTEVWTGHLEDVGKVIARRSRRSQPSRAWEWALLRHLRDMGIEVPDLIPSAGGDVDVDGWHVYHYIDGREPSAEDPRLVRSIGRVHRATSGWPQRPGSASARDLLVDSAGGEVNLDGMPDVLVDAVRGAWTSALHLRESTSVVHGDFGSRNALIDTRGRCVLIDWDEARVDDPLFDLPESDTQKRAALAWEIATCWSVEPTYARSLVEAFTQ